MEQELSKKEKPLYNDLYFRVAISLLAAHFIIAFGIDKTLWELLLMTAYYRALAASFIIAFILVTAVYMATVKLDRRWPWEKNYLFRLLYQTCFGLILPSAAAFVLAAIYFALYGMNILHTVYLKYDFPVIVLFLLILNIYYFAFNQYLLARRNRFAGQQTNDDRNGKYKKVFVVNKGTDNLPISADGVAYFYHSGDYNFLRLFDGSEYLLSQSLDETEKQVDPRSFFRANRQFIVNYNACRSFQQLEYNKLELSVEPNYKEGVIISQLKAKGFKEWMEKKGL
jgi:DNA-binding LytR/AlgR family response regulator